MSIYDPIASLGNLEVSSNLRVTNYTDNSATVGNATVNALRGKSTVALGAGTCVITNNLVTVNSQIIVTVEANDATLKSLIATPTAGSFTVRGNDVPTADAKFSWIVIN